MYISPRSTSGTTRADLLMAASEPVTFPHASNGQSPTEDVVFRRNFLFIFLRNVLLRSRHSDSFKKINLTLSGG